MKLIIDDIKDFELRQILDCGQCFRWAEEEDGSWTGVADGKIANLRLEDRILEIETNRKDEDPEKEMLFWRNYLDLDRDYGKIKKKLAASDEVVKKAITYGEGIRILNQDMWEVLISFIISQNNNIPRIRGCIEKLSAILGDLAGEPLILQNGKTAGSRFCADGKGRAMSFPTVERLANATLEDLAPVRLGYRAPYLIETARAVLDEKCFREDLRSYKGVGPKVASCIELFGRHNMAAFPIDVWVKRVMNRMYGIPEGNVKEMQKYAEEHFGELGGIAQQYLFYYIRILDEA